MQYCTLLALSHTTRLPSDILFYIKSDRKKMWHPGNIILCHYDKNDSHFLSFVQI